MYSILLAIILSAAMLFPTATDIESMQLNTTLSKEVQPLSTPNLNPPTPMIAPAQSVDPTVIKKLTDQIKGLKTAIGVNEQLLVTMHGDGLTRAVDGIAKQKIQLADLERQLAELTAP